MKRGLLLLALFSCIATQAQNWKRLNKKYNKAVAITATKSDSARLYDKLDPIDTSQDWVSVACWKGYLSPYGQKGDTITLDSQEYVTWIFQTSQFQTVGKALELHEMDNVDLSIRLDQLLGLAPNPSDTSRQFVQMWVKPADLFRPCPDPEIGDTSCELYLPSTDSKRMVGTMSYREWFVNNIYEAYYEASNQPWTRLGYTWDWNKNNREHIGLSEYIIEPGAVVIIQDIAPTVDWVRKNIK